jgi:hypothetical protein
MDDTPHNPETPPPAEPPPAQEPPPPPAASRSPRQGAYGAGDWTNWPTGARMPIPGNAEWALWFIVEILFAIIWAASDSVDASGFVTATAIVTFAYLISRGIAKASRVLEQ